MGNGLWRSAGGRRGAAAASLALWLGVLVADATAGLVAGTAPPMLVPVGNPMRITITVSNTGTASVTGLVPSLHITSGGALLGVVPRPVPATLRSLAAGASTAFVWTFSVTGRGSVGFTGTVKGMDSGIHALVSGSATALWAVGWPGVVPPRGNIYTAAGTGKASYNGDNIPATVATLSAPYGLALDAAGNVFIADYNNHRIRKVAIATRKISTVAGTGDGGYNGDGIPATSAKLYHPSGVQVDAAGNLYIEDGWNNRVRRVDGVTGIITTVAGTGAAGFSPDGTRATSAKMHFPGWGALDPAGNVCYSDLYNNVIRRVDAVTGLVSTIAGTGTEGYNGDGIPATSAKVSNPCALAFDSAGNLYFSDDRNNRIRKVSAATGLISTVAGNGTAGYNGDGIAATSAEFINPLGIALDPAGNLYIADWNGHRIRRVDAVTGLISTIAGTGTAGYNGDGIAASGSQLNSPVGVALDGAGRVYVLEQAGHRLRRIDAAAPGKERAAREAEAAAAPAVPAPVPPASSPAVGAVPAPPPTRTSAPGKVNVAIADLSGQNVSAGDAAVVSDMLRNELVKTQTVNVLERSNMERLLAEQGFQQTGCTSSECAVKLGKMLNVQMMVVGSFGHLLTTYYVNVRVVDVQTGTVAYSDVAKGKNEDELGVQLGELAIRLAGALRQLRPREWQTR